MTLDPIELLRETKLGTSPGAASSSGCLKPGALAALAEGSLSERPRAAALEHLVACLGCRSELASLARALHDPGVAQELRVVEARTLRFWWRFALPAAAAAALLLLAYPMGWLTDRGESVHRSPTVTRGVSPAPQAPIGTVAGVSDLRWSSVPGADRYRVTLFDATGRVHYEAELADTIVPLPDSVGLVPRQRYLWRVEARTAFRRWVASDLIEFSVEGAPRR